MMDFLSIGYRTTKTGYEVYPDFLVKKSTTLMIRGGEFYGIWDQEAGLWCTDIYDVQRLVDAELDDYAKSLREEKSTTVRVSRMSDFSSGSWSQFKLYITKIGDNYDQLDNTITFSDSKVGKTDYVSRRLPYPLESCDTPAFDELMSTLYDEGNLQKIKWAIGSIINGSSKDIQKFFVFFGDPGTGKSTALNIIQRLFPGYYTTFEAKTLVAGGSFATEAFRANPLIAINHDGDLSRIKDNSLLSSLVGHDEVSMSVKYQHTYSIRLNTLLLIATNKPVSITDAKSGLVRRLIDVRPTGNLVGASQYDVLTSQIGFELSGIAYSCLEVYNELGKNYYNHYRPIDMMMRTNVMFNFVDDNRLEFQNDDYITLSRAYTLYKEYCDSSGIEYRLPRYRFRDEFNNYWDDFLPVTRIDKVQYRSVFTGFNSSRFENSLIQVEEPDKSWIRLASQESKLDILWANEPAQNASVHDTPAYKWDEVTTSLSAVDTSTLHYVLPPENHIVIDFDLTDDDGQKSLPLNIAAAEQFPPTYAELSKGGQGLHLHYIYDGDATKLSRVYAPDIDVLIPKGKFSIRRRLSECNDLGIAVISSGLPLKGVKMTKASTLTSEKSLRMLLMRNLHKEIHPATKPSVDFMYTILTEAAAGSLVYDVTDMQKYLLDFAANSSNNASYCIEKVLSMPLTSGGSTINTWEPTPVDTRLTFFDVEIFPPGDDNPGLFLICWKIEGEGNLVHRMVNPSPAMIEGLMKQRLVGYNNRRYDNHMLYAAYLGYNNEQLYKLSSAIVSNDRSVLFPSAYGLSYADVYDYSSIKKSLKQHQIDIGIFHMELDMPWDKPAPESRWDEVAEYCENDVVSLELVHERLHQDYRARQIIAEISGKRINDSTRVHAQNIVFGNNRNPQKEFNIPDLSDEFPGYTFKKEFTTPKLPPPELGEPPNPPRKKEWVSRYLGEDPGEGGYVYATPGMYKDVLYLDVSSMHPFSIINMNLFGKYTPNFANLVYVRIAIKNGDYAFAEKAYDGRLKKYLGNREESSELAYALKIVINSVYGLTFARFPNPFRSKENKDNVVAKRGALFMLALKHALKERGVTAVHFKTDSVKIVDHNESDVEFIIEFGKKYGYDFGIEGTFEKMALVNDAVLIAKWKDGPWYAVGTQFAKPYVHKTLFTKEPITLEDMAEKRSVTTKMYLDFDEDGTEAKQFIGKVGIFCPIKQGKGGATLLRRKGDEYHAVTGTKGYRWLPYQMVLDQGRINDVDRSYFDTAVDDALTTLGKFGDVSVFLD